MFLRGERHQHCGNKLLYPIIPKSGKDSKDCGSYRPMSIVNVDYRLYYHGKTFENIIPDLIVVKKTAFVKNRQTQDNVKWQLYITDWMKKNQNL